MHILLIHGLARTPLSLLGLARDLRRADYRTELVAYSGALESYDSIVARARRRLEGAARPASHTFMMNNRQVRAAVREILSRASASSGKEDPRG